VGNTTPDYPPNVQLADPMLPAPPESASADNPLPDHPPNAPPADPDPAPPPPVNAVQVQVPPRADRVPTARFAGKGSGLAAKRSTVAPVAASAGGVASTDASGGADTSGVSCPVDAPTWFQKGFTEVSRRTLGPRYEEVL
jgi:hypothetical protein